MRQFIASMLPDKKGSIVLSEKEKRYLINVLRLKRNDEIDVRLPNGIVCTMRIQFCNNDAKKTGKVELVVVESLAQSDGDNASEALPIKNEYWLFQILPKTQKMDLIVRQATECGVSVIVPVIGEYSVNAKGFDSLKENDTKRERWLRIVREAQQQSGSPIDTKIVPPCTIEKAMELWQEKNMHNTIGFVLRERQENQESIFSLIQKKKNSENICVGFVVGCEGGISPSELKTFEECNFHPIHFDTNILRAETASLYGIAVLQTVLEEFNAWKELKE